MLGIITTVILQLSTVSNRGRLPEPIKVETPEVAIVKVLRELEPVVQIEVEEEPEPDPTPEPVAVTTVSGYKPHEIDLLARLVKAEAQGESYAGKVAVAEVVLNRIRSAEFPNSVEAVVYQQGQFSPVSDGSINVPATDMDRRAVEDALQGTNYTNGALFFYNPNTATSRWLDGKPTKVVIGNHSFK